MSVYSFGKVIGKGGAEEMTKHIQHLALRSDISVKLGALDPEDEITLQESPWLRAQGLIFNVFTPGDADIGVIYNEVSTAGTRAMEKILERPVLFGSWAQVESLSLPDQVRDSMQTTRLGRLVVGLFRLQLVSKGGLAIFDGGVDQIIEETPEACLQSIFKAFLVPWHTGPNALFVWH